MNNQEHLSPPKHSTNNPSRVVLLAGPGAATDIVANFLNQKLKDLVIVMEHPQSRVALAKRRARRIGWVQVFGQTLFITVVMPVMVRLGVRRRAEILEKADLSDTPCIPDYVVDSVNDDGAIDLLQKLSPDLIVVFGTRIIAQRVLESVPCPFINVHAGITPQYRGVHGGYWARAEGRPEMMGTTIHLVDPGIDTGGVLARRTFDSTPGDSIATYPYLHLAVGLPALSSQIDIATGGGELKVLAALELVGPSRLHFHPTIWGYLSLWMRNRTK